MIQINIGDQEPEITAINQHEEEIKLSNFLGTQVILYCYPRDKTPGCTTEACNFRDNYEELSENGYVVLGVSTDGLSSHQKFATKHELPFHLLVDEEKNIVNQYGVWVEKNMYGRKYMGTARTTFLIDEKGVVRDIIKKVKNKEATKQVLEAWEQIQ